MQFINSSLLTHIEHDLQQVGTQMSLQGKETSSHHKVYEEDIADSYINRTDKHTVPEPIMAMEIQHSSLASKEVDIDFDDYFGDLGALPDTSRYIYSSLIFDYFNKDFSNEDGKH